jgi:Ax21 family sulfation-dependent quorum factor
MKRALFALALAAALPMSAQAAERSYSFVELDYVNVDGDADGFGVRGAVNFGDSNFYGLGRYASVEVDNTNIDVDSYEVGVGYHHSLTDNADLIAELAYLNNEVVGFDVDGYRLSGGFRGNLAESFEGLAKLNYIDGSDFDGDFTLTLGGQYKFNDTWGLTGEIEFADDSVETYTVGVRASF